MVNTIISDKIRMKRRTELMKRHNLGTLPKSFYSKDKKTGKPVLLPSKLKGY